MYNCARLATLFEGYKRSMEQGLYPTFPPVSSLDFSLLQDEVSALLGYLTQAGALDFPSQHPCTPQGEWLLLFNSVLPFPDLLSQTAVLTYVDPGLRITARTEMVRHRRPEQTCHTLLFILGWSTKRHRPVTISVSRYASSWYSSAWISAHTITGYMS